MRLLLLEDVARRQLQITMWSARLWYYNFAFKYQNRRDNLG